MLEFDRGEAVVVEEFLPLADHPEVAIVHDDELDVEAVIGEGGEFRDGHLEAAVAADGEDRLIGMREGCADGGRQSEAHGAEAAGGKPEARID